MISESASNFGSSYKFIIDDPYHLGYRQLTAVSGFASAALVRQILQDYPNIELKLIIGMAAVSGISDADHRTYSDLIHLFPERFQCNYYAGNPAVHAKFYVWQGDGIPALGIITSSNFSWSGLGGYYEAGVHVEAASLLNEFNKLRERSLSVLSPEVGRRIRVFEASRRTAGAVSNSHGSIQTNPDNLERATLSLLSAQGQMHTAAGLNWGQREGRNPNQAYIPVPASFYQEHPEFLPPRGRRFVVRTDDGAVFTCVTAQANNKAIETPDDNSVLGLYFRTRMGLESGVFVELADLERYGRSNVEFTKIDSDIYLMDFHSPTGLPPS